MRALRFETFGAPSVLTIEELPMPAPGAGEALVEVRAAAVNPSDVKNLAGVFKASLPRVPGRDYAGVVAGGEGWKGKEVWGSGAGFGVTRDGAHAHYVVVAMDALSEKPARLSMEEASAIGVPYLAAWSALVDAAEMQAGETVLITGAGGAVGRAATQIARWKKARVIAADVTNQGLEAEAFVDAKAKHFPEEVRALTDGRGVDLVLDAVGGPMFEPCLKSLRIGGRQVAITSLGTARVEFSLTDFYHNALRLIGLDTMKFTGARISGIMDHLKAGFEEGHLRPPRVHTWPLDRAVDAYLAVEKGTGSIKQVILPGRT